MSHTPIGYSPVTLALTPCPLCGKTPEVVFDRRYRPYLTRYRCKGHLSSPATQTYQMDDAAGRWEEAVRAFVQRQEEAMERDLVQEQDDAIQDEEDRQRGREPPAPPPPPTQGTAEVWGRWFCWSLEIDKIADESLRGFVDKMMNELTRIRQEISYCDRFYNEGEHENLLLRRHLLEGQEAELRNLIEAVWL